MIRDSHLIGLESICAAGKEVLVSAETLRFNRSGWKFRRSAAPFCSLSLSPPLCWHCSRKRRHLRYRLLRKNPSRHSGLWSSLGRKDSGAR